MKQPARPTGVPRKPGSKNEAGFTIMEAIIATMILTFGLASIFNLMIMSTTSNTVAARATGALALATAQMETLRSTPFSSLVDSPEGVDTLEEQTEGYFVETTIEGTGTFETRWRVQTLTSANLKFLSVRTDPQGFRGRAGRAEFTTVRACTAGTTAGCF